VIAGHCFDAKAVILLRGNAHICICSEDHDSLNSTTLKVGQELRTSCILLAEAKREGKGVAPDPHRYCTHVICGLQSESMS